MSLKSFLNQKMIPQDSVAKHKSKSHLKFQEQVSGSQYIYATQSTATKIM